MLIGKVIGTVVATVKDPSLEGVKLLVVQPLDDEMKPKGKPIVAADAIRTSGIGETVYLVSKREASIPFETLPPVDSAITGFIDEYYVVKKEELEKEK